MTHDVTLIPGDGIGPEIAAAMEEVVAATGVDGRWRRERAGAQVYEGCGTPLPDSVLEAVAETKVAIKGPTATPVGSGFRSINVALRRAFDLYACVRPCLSMPGDGSRYRDVDLVVVRENTEDLYAGVEFEAGTPEAGHIIASVNERTPGAIRPSSAISVKPISPEGSERIVRYAFEYALSRGRRRVCCVHKANIMKATDGLFMHVAERVAEDYPDIAFECRIVDACCMGLVCDPADFDVLVLPNLYGDIVSDLCAGLIGGLGLAPGANIGSECAIFEATHGSAPDIAGKDMANPTALILSAAMMLDHLGEPGAADAVRDAVREVLAEGTSVTADICRALTDSAEGAVGCAAYGHAVAEAVRARV